MTGDGQVHVNLLLGMTRAALNMSLQWTLNSSATKLNRYAKDENKIFDSSTNNDWSDDTYHEPS